MINVKQLLYEISEDDRVFLDDIDLIESGVIDSFTFIEFFAVLEDYDIFLQPTQIDRNKLRTVNGIEDLIKDYLNNKRNS